MKIYKIAQNIPEGFVRLRVTIGKKGDFKSQFIRDGASQCSEGSGEFLEDILNTSVPGFGNEFEDGDPQKSPEYWEQTRPQVPMTVGVAPQEEEEDVVTKRPEKRLDQGYGA